MYQPMSGCEASGVHLIAELPANERPRERLQAKGADALADAELLAILLRTGARGRSVLDLARDILVRFDYDLDVLSRASVQDLREVRGVGTAKAVEIHAAFALARRLVDNVGRDPLIIDGPDSVARLMREQFRQSRQEEFHVLYLNTKNAVLLREQVTVGLLDRSPIHAREVFRTAVRESCSRVLLVHNHPSGDPTPSPEDIACTEDLVKAGKIIGIDVLDHVVIGRRTQSRIKDYVSFREEGLLP